jgi:hypothetical protein
VRARLAPEIEATVNETVEIPTAEVIAPVADRLVAVTGPVESAPEVNDPDVDKDAAVRGPFSTSPFPVIVPGLNVQEKQALQRQR